MNDSQASNWSIGAPRWRSPTVSLVWIMFSLQPLVYPKAVGHVLSVDAVTTTGPMADAFFSITLVGGLLLALMLSLYVAVAARGPSGPDV